MAEAEGLPSIPGSLVRNGATPRSHRAIHWVRMLRAKLPVLLVLLALYAQAATIPRKAPPFAIQMNDGKQVQLGTYKGKVVVLAFILTTCPHCQAVTRVLNKLQPEYAPCALSCASNIFQCKQQRFALLHQIGQSPFV